ncbi:MAG TPA: PQQ-binding-like beta-propeller repeat protein [Acidimicrobiales bacterium]|nr:PQQ-binding-like beta-propeller repeat protein [Acidimicrobiales bacterium]
MAQSGWFTYGHDAQRSADDPTSPPAGKIRLSWTSPTLDGAVYAQPLVTSQAVVVATEDDSVYSLNPSDGIIQWRRHLSSPVSGSSLPCGDIDPSGITGTPVIDPASGLVWVVTFSGLPAKHTLWALRLTDGSIAASRPADPAGSNPATEQQRGALALAHDRVYIPYGGLYGDCGDYHGQLVGFSTKNSAPRPVTYTTPAARAGIWAPPGAVVDSAGDLLVTTGNGLPVNPPGDANSVIRLAPDLTVVGTFTAPDFETLSETDGDLGSTSPAITAGGDLLQVGKEGVAYLLGPDLRAIDTTKVCAGGFGGTAVAGTTVFLSCFDGLYALRVDAGSIGVLWKATSLRPGPPVVAGGVVWAVDRGGHLDGFDARTGALTYTHAITIAGSFPTLAAHGGTLFVPAGDRVEAFRGA